MRQQQQAAIFVAFGVDGVHGVVQAFAADEEGFVRVVNVEHEYQIFFFQIATDG